MLPGESYQDMFARVSGAFADDDAHAQRLYDYMSKLWFMPSTPILSNGGAGRGLPISCYLNSMDDSIDSIKETWMENVDLAKLGGGIGTYAGNIRGIGEKVGNSGETSGVIPFIKVMDSLTLAISQGSLRRGSAAVYLDIHHPEIEEFLEIRKATGDMNRRSLNLHHGINITDEFMHAVRDGAEFNLRSPKTGETTKTVDARLLWQKVLDIRMQTGEPYLLFTDTVAKAQPEHHKALGLKVTQSNLCVAPETRILTREGYVEIADVENKPVEVWNGLQWSKSIVRKTGEDQELIRVEMSNGASLDCTPYHKFYVQRTYSGSPVEVRAHDLKPGDKLIKSEFPVVEGGDDWEDAYQNGFFTADGCVAAGKPIIYLYQGKRDLLPAFEHLGRVYDQQNQQRMIVQFPTARPKHTVPHDASVKTRLEWFAGFVDGDGTRTVNGDTQSCQATSIDRAFLNEVRLMLNTLGVCAKVRPMLPGGDREMPGGTYFCQPSYRLMFGEKGVQQLLSLGWEPKRLAFVKRTPQRAAVQFVTVESVNWDGRISDTYCFTETKRGMGVFEGVLTGQCVEIVLPTGNDHLGNKRTAVCCLSSVNAEKFLKWKDEPLFIEDIMRFLDNVLEDFIKRAPPSMANAVYAAMRERSVGLGLMGFHSFLQSQGVAFESAMAKSWNMRMFKHLRREADKASVNVAKEKGANQDWYDAEWLKGEFTSINPEERFSHKLAIAPTASISVICGGTSAGIEPIPANIYTHKTLSGSFTVKNPFLSRVLDDYGKNTDATWNSILEHEGSVQHLDFLTDQERDTFKTAFEIDQRWVVELAADRAPMICQGQSVNLFIPADVDKWDLHMLHWSAWEKGVKSLYYLRSKSVQRASFAGSDGIDQESFDAPSTVDYDECLACQ